MAEVKKVYAAINAVQNELSHIGIEKTRSNQQQGYKFRGIDDVYNTIAGLLADHKLCILPRALSRTCDVRKSTKGNDLFYVVLEVEYDFVSAEDGSIHTIKTFGEAMDSADKATNKALSAAYKCAIIQTFSIPTVGEDDADFYTPEHAPHETKAAIMQAKPTTIEPYSDESFATNMPKWEGMIRSGKVTADQIIGMVGSKAILSQGQKDAIKAISLRGASK